MRYTFRQLEYFIAAGETGSITLASERLHISQPSISTAIAHLERELRTQLFVRHHAQGLSLTPSGRTLLQEARRVIERAEALRTLAPDSGEEVSGQLAVGCMVTLAPMMLPELSRSFTDAHPAVQIRHMVNNQEQLLEGLRRVEIDIALTYDLQIPDGIDFTPLAALPAHALLGEDHPLAEREEVSLGELAALPLVLLDLPLSREYFLALFMKEGLEPRIAMRSSQPDVVRTMVANGFGYTLANVRPRARVALDGRLVKRVPLIGEHRPMRVGLATLAALARTRLVEAFAEHCQAAVTDARLPGMDGQDQ